MPHSSHNLLAAAKSGDQQAVGQLLEDNRARLRRMVRVRLHPLVRPRVDESDILQNAFLDASRRIEDYFETSSLPFYLWLRHLTDQQIRQCHRHHLDIQKRSVRQDRRLDVGDASLSFCMASYIVSQDTSPPDAAAREELRESVHRVLDQLNEVDREILCMRHLEQMSNAEVATALNIPSTNASTRHLRALVKLQKGLAKLSVSLPQKTKTPSAEDGDLL